MSAQPNPATPVVIDKSFLLAQLQETRDIFLNSFAGVTEEQSRLKPASDQWSVLDTVEHLTTAETVQLKLISTQRAPRPADSPNREHAFLQMIPNRTHKLEAPEIAKPNGRFATLAEAAEQFKTTRAGVIRFLEQYTEDLRASEVKHPHPAAGMVSICEMLVAMAMHAKRHAAQIEETRKTLKLS
ncbi:MAG TPA: DinB family protein [Candidatus Angelobacter sp.]|nr:DinB family protein [Candidatus Angelobacter sp.]